ncbi:ATP-binding protein [Streptomyces aurantiacus]|uniref:ATP-binding protein n=1 Tax=Streptomyces aurantiacus TaxID=47760 RepID=UPI00056A6290|nr:ATP-binding protein [Streptomyces aurantiacus]
MPAQVQTPTPAHTFTQRISATPRGARLARRLTRYHLDGWGIPYDSELSDAVAQVAAELAANAATHGRVSGRDFALRLLLLADGVRIEVTDTRTECRPPERPELPSPDEESGRGLVLVAALATRWGVDARSVGKTVWAEVSPPGG